MSDVNEFERTIASFIAGSQNPLIAEILGAAPPVDWVLPDFLPQGSLIALAGSAGCLSGNTWVKYKRGARSGGRTIVLSELYKKFNNIKSSNPPQWSAGTTYLQSLTESETVFYNQVVGVYESGAKCMVQLDFNDGTSLQATHNHPVMTGNGFVIASELHEGGKVTAKGSMFAHSNGGRDYRQSSRPNRIIVNTRYHPYGAAKTVQCNGVSYMYTRVPRARLVIEAKLNNVSYKDYVGALKHDPAASSRFMYIPTDFEVHHADENTLNDSIDNLEVMTKAQHAQHHNQVRNFRFDYTTTKTVQKITELPAEMTYDVQMTSPANNFCANDVVVHNTGKSYLCYTIGMALATGTPIFDLVPPQPTKVLYFDNENANPDRIQYERWAWNGLGKPSLELLEQNFWRQPFQLGGSDWSNRLESDIKYFKPRVVFIDTASPCFNVQDENDNAEATRIINKLRVCQTAITPTVTMVILKHSKIKAEDTGSGYHTLRGAKAWEGAVDAIVYQIPGAGRPRNDGLRNTRLQPSKTRAFGLRTAIEIYPSWVGENGEKSGLKLERRV